MVHMYSWSFLSGLFSQMYYKIFSRDPAAPVRTKGPGELVIGDTHYQLAFNYISWQHISQYFQELLGYSGLSIKKRKGNAIIQYENLNFVGTSISSTSL